jgi:hypothetical protein
VLTLVVICIFVVAAVGVVVYVTRTVKPRRVKFSAGVWKLVSLSYEADAGSEPKELPPAPDKPIPGGR